MCMAKCSITKEKVSETFLNKALGTYIKDEHGKRFLVSSEVQRKYHNDKKKMLETIKGS